MAFSTQGQKTSRSARRKGEPCCPPTLGEHAGKEKSLQSNYSAAVGTARASGTQTKPAAGVGRRDSSSRLPTINESNTNVHLLHCTLTNYCCSSVVPTTKISPPLPPRPICQFRSSTHPSGTPARRVAFAPLDRPPTWIPSNRHVEVPEAEEQLLARLVHQQR